MWNILRAGGSSAALRRGSLASPASGIPRALPRSSHQAPGQTRRVSRNWAPPRWRDQSQRGALVRWATPPQSSSSPGDAVSVAGGQTAFSHIASLNLKVFLVFYGRFFHFFFFLSFFFFFVEVLSDPERFGPQDHMKGKSNTFSDTQCVSGHKTSYQLDKSVP